MTGEQTSEDTHPRPFPTAEAERAFLAAYDAMLERWPVPVEPVDVPSEFGRTHVQVCGPPDAPPLVLLNGGGSNSTMWYANVGELAARHRVYALDRLGGPGRSMHSGRALSTVDDLEDWLDAVLDGLGLSSVDLCAHSYGAWIALHYALHAPKRVRRLVLLEPSNCFAGMRLNYLRHALPMLLRETPRRIHDFLTWECSAVGLDPQWSALAELSSGFRATKPVTGPRPDRARLRTLAVPTLVLLAERSRQHDTGRVARNARRLLPDVRTLLLPGSTHHSVPMRDAGAVNRAVLDFLG